MEETATSPADVGAVDERSPWPGLASFREPDQKYFRGREQETADLVRLVRRARLTLLLGKSGLGKTSLLNAGVFPVLRQEDVLPVPIRLGFSAGSPPLVDQVRQAISGATSRARVEGPSFMEEESLWEGFHRKGAEFWSDRHRLVTPLLVFDQFEEIFTLGRRDATARRASDAFIDELADLIDGSAPDAVKERLEEHPGRAREFNFGRHQYKLLLSLREDFLPQLEVLRERIGALAHNRFRLRSMRGGAALAVVTQVPDLIDDSTAHKVVRFVAAADLEDSETQLEELEVEPALLSVVCRELNNRRLQQGDAKIGVELLEEGREEILSGLYERSFSDLPAEARTFVEDRLVTASGYRDSVALENALERASITRDVVDRLVERRLLRIDDGSGIPRVELSHDLLTGVVVQSRDARRRRDEEEIEREERQERERLEREAWLKRWKALAGWGGGVLLVLLAAALVVAVMSQVKMRRANASLQAALRAQEASQKELKAALEKATIERDRAEETAEAAREAVAAWEFEQKARRALGEAITSSSAAEIGAKMVAAKEARAAADLAAEWAASRASNVLEGAAEVAKGTSEEHAASEATASGDEVATTEEVPSDDVPPSDVEATTESVELTPPAEGAATSAGESEDVAEESTASEPLEDSASIAATVVAPRVFVVATGTPPQRRDQALIALETLLRATGVDVKGSSTEAPVGDGDPAAVQAQVNNLLEATSANLLLHMHLSVVVGARVDHLTVTCYEAQRQIWNTRAEVEEGMTIRGVTGRLIEDMVDKVGPRLAEPPFANQ